MSAYILGDRAMTKVSFSRMLWSFRPYLTAAMLFFGSAGSGFTHQGWGDSDTARPIYVEGTVESVNWRNPHVSVSIRMRQLTQIPDYLRRIPMPQSDANGTALPLPANLALAPDQSGTWLVESLAPNLNERFGMASRDIKVGDTIGIVGFFLCEGGERIRAQILILDERRAVRQRVTAITPRACGA